MHRHNMASALLVTLVRATRAIVQNFSPLTRSKKSERKEEEEEEEGEKRLRMSFVRLQYNAAAAVEKPKRSTASVFQAQVIYLGCVWPAVYLCTYVRT